MKDRIKTIQNNLIKIYVLLMFGLLPLVMHNGYHDMGETKFAFFRGASVLLFDAIVILFVIRFIKSSDLKTFFKIRLRTTDFFAICFLVLSFISFLLSSYKEDALWGFEGWNMGLLSQLLFVFIFFCVSRSDDAGDIVFYVSGVAGTIVSVIAILQRFGFDPFGFYRGIEDVYRYEFLSTIGQKTWFSSYLMIVIPVCIHLFITKESIVIKSSAGLSIFVTTCADLMSYSDSALLGIALILLITGCLYAGDKGNFSEFLKVLTIEAVSLLGVITVGGNLYGSGEMSDDDMIMKILSRPIPFAAMSVVSIICCVAVIVYLGRTKSEWEKYKGKIRGFLVVFALFGSFVAFILSGSGSEFSETGILSDSWGNNRGFIWRIAIETFGRGSLKDKLIGVGPDMFYNASDSLFHDEIYHMWGDVRLPNAHNEFLNMLVTEGLLGVIAYIGLFTSSLAAGVRGSKKNRDLIPLTAALAAYIAHNFFCYQQCVATPLIFIVLGMISKKDN